MRQNHPLKETPLLRCTGLTCGYGDKVVLSGVDLTVASGEVVVLLGPNGSGKSTLLRTISAELAPISGQIELGGQDIRSIDQRSLAQLVAVAPQEETHRFEFSVLQVAAMGRHARSNAFFDSDEDIQLSLEALKTADCENLSERRITEISGGEKQRVLIARALVQDTPLLLLDEPTSHLDVAHQIAFARVIREISARGKAVIAAVHDLNLASMLATRGIVLSAGKVAADMPIAELMLSNYLDEAYNVRFERLTGSDGNLRLYANL